MLRPLLLCCAAVGAAGLIHSVSLPAQHAARVVLATRSAADRSATREQAWFSQWMSAGKRRRERSQARRVNMDLGAEAPMPPILSEWGCDEALWEQIRGAKGSLRKLAREGDEEQARRRIESIRKVVEDEAKGIVRAPPPRQAARKASVQAESASRTANPNRRPAKPLSAGYSQEGTVPDGFDVATVETMLQARVKAKKAKEYAAADELQSQLAAMGVLCDDRARTWSVA